MTSDLELQRSVLDELTWDPSVDAANIGVSVDSGIVALNGHVKSFAEKWAAERVAQRVSNVKAVTDELVVKLPGDHERSDSDIARAALNALDWNSIVPNHRIKVLVDDGWITLDGDVEFFYQKEEAECAVRNLLGVRGVVNTIRIMPLVRPSDIRQKIEKALQRAAELDAKKISVEANQGNVVLRGKVRSWAERTEAEHAAWAAPGVTNVKNEISITV
jgi:osmotically-inducible protein OsmY